MALDWKDLSPAPPIRSSTPTLTRKPRIILMNGIEVEAVMFGHNFNRNCEDNDLRRELALVRRIEAGQQKQVNWLLPSDETPLETTHRLRAAGRRPHGVAGNARARRVREGLHGLRPAGGLRPPVPLREPAQNDEDLPAHQLVQDTIEITPGRPTIAHHRHPIDSVRAPRNAKTADIRTTLGALILTAGEQQTMNYYMNLGKHAAGRRRARPLPGDRHG